jgi:CubicO group peptidase (beta-lactamase class C family)
VSKGANGKALLRPLISLVQGTIVKRFSAGLTLLSLLVALAGVCSAQEAAKLRAVDDLFSKFDRSGSPGAAVAVVRDGKVVVSKGYGLASIENQIPISSSTVFDVASVAKQFTGLAVAMLVQQGSISLGDDIRKYIPELHDMGSTITIGHLLHHTSGLRDWPATLHVAGWQFDDVISFDQILWMAYNQTTLNFTPGAEYTYSNTEYNLLAEMVARVTGTSFRAWTDEHIFGPLGMTHTHFREDRTEVIPNRAFGYAQAPDGAYHITTDNLVASGSSSLFTTADDLTKWLINFDNAAVGGRSAIALMLTRGVLNDGSSIPYAFGVIRGDYRGLPTVEHDGGWASFSTFAGRFPEQRFGVIVLANSGSIDATRLAREVADILLETELAPRRPAGPAGATMPSVEVAPAILDSYAGLYRLGPGWYVRIRRDGRELKARATREAEFPMTPRSQGEFWVEDYQSSMTFERTRTGDTTYLTYHGQRHPRLDEPGPLTRAQLADFAGEYFSDELQTSYRVEARDSALVMLHPRYGTIPLTQFWRDEFGCPLWFGNVQFQRDDAGMVIGFSITAGNRSRNNRFVKRRM